MPIALVRVIHLIAPWFSSAKTKTGYDKELDWSYDRSGSWSYPVSAQPLLSWCNRNGLVADVILLMTRGVASTAYIWAAKTDCGKPLRERRLQSGMAMVRVQLRHGALLWLVARHCALLFRSRQLGGCCDCRLPVARGYNWFKRRPFSECTSNFSQEPTLPQDQVGVSWEWCRLHLSASSTWLLHDFLAPKQKLGTIKSLIGLTTDQALDRTQFLLNLYCLDATEMVWLQM